MQIIAMMNQKGGVGKTTAAVNIAAGLARIGRRVLLIDTDPQAHATLSLGISDELENTVFEVLDEKVPASKAIIRRSDGLAVIPSGLQLAGAELHFIGVPGREILLRRAINELSADFDFIFIDCPPYIGVLTMNALAAATGVYIPIKTEFLSTRGISQLTQTIDLIRQRLNPELRISGALGTFYDSRRTLDREIMETVRQIFGAAVFKTLIRTGVTLAEAPGFGKTIFEHAPASHGAEDFAELCQEIVAREDLN